MGFSLTDLLISALCMFTQTERLYPLDPRTLQICYLESILFDYVAVFGKSRPSECG